ncbi:MAG: hypothetical protein FJ313_08705, partial [Gemmatimonadetes bacterium]|nr:hypothetical protein [Gemmatimonadota bacterium]
MTSQTAGRLRVDPHVQAGLIEALRRRPGQDQAPPSPPEGKATLTRRGAAPQAMRFDTWVPFQANHSVLEIAQAIARADEPPLPHNPLYIHSGPGLGKTHLLSAIASRRGRDVLLINVTHL